MSRDPGVERAIEPQGSYEGWPAVTLESSELSATFVPDAAGLGASLRYDGQEFLFRAASVNDYASAGAMTGLPFMHPWANRLRGHSYAFGDAAIDLDAQRLPIQEPAIGGPIHGFTAAALPWRVAEISRQTLRTELDFGPELECFAGFPFAHRVTQTIAVTDNRLTIESRVEATGATAVPVAFGFHPFLKFPTTPRDEWQLTLPTTEEIVLDGMLPTGETRPIGPLNQKLGQLAFDNCYRNPGQSVEVQGGGYRISLQGLIGYDYVQIFAPPDADYICLEPMTATAAPFDNDGQALHAATPGQPYKARFELQIDTLGA